MIVARYKVDDPLQTAAEEFFKTSGSKYVSPLTIVELYSVYSRVLGSIEFPRFKERMDDAEKLEAAVQASLADCALSIAVVPLSATWILGKQSATVPLEYSEARNLSDRIRLRTLDLLHVAYSSILLKTGTPISQLVTGDHQLISQSSAILGLTGIRIVLPAET